MASQVDILIRAIGGEAAAGVIGQVQSALKSMQSTWAGVTGALAAVGVTLALRDLLSAAEEARVATFRLDTALRTSGQAAEGVAESLALQAEALQGLTGVSNDTTLAVQSMLLSMGATVNQVSRLSPLVLDVAAAMGTDASSAARQLGQALHGQEIQIGKLNIRAKDFDDLLVQLNSRVGGQAEALMAARGPAAQLAVDLSRLSGTVGELLSHNLSPFFERLAAGIRRVNEDLAGSPAYRGFGKGMRSGLFPLNPVSTNSPGQQFNGIDVESESIEGERARQATAAQELLRVEADLNNLYGFRRSLIEQDPTMSDPDRRRALVGVMRDELPVLQQREDLLRAEFERQLQADPSKALETTIEAESRLQQSQLERIRIAEEIGASENNETFRGQMTLRVKELTAAYGNLSVAMANVAFDTVMAGFQGLAGALTSIITGAKSAGQAFAEFGMTMLTNFIQTVLTTLLYAKLALPILSALGVASGGASFAGGTAVVGSGLAFGLAAGASAALGSKASGGYAGDGGVFEPAGVYHGGEFIVPAWRTAEIGVPALEQMTFGESGGGSQGIVIRPIVVHDQRSAERLMRDPNFISFIMDLRDA